MQPDEPSTATDRPPVVDRAPELVVEVVHATRLDEQGPFVVASCTCGWRSYARRSRPLARSEAKDHHLLHAGA